MNKNINFEKLQIFMLLYELQSFSVVAKTLDISQSVVSRTIQDLENSIGKKLVLNNQKPITLTEDGKKLYAITQEINSEVKGIENNIIFQHQNIKYKKIKISISIDMIFSLLLSEKMNKILEQFPEVIFDIGFNKTLDLDLLHKKDFIISKEKFEHILIESKYIKSYDMAFCASRNYLKKNGYPRYISSLQYHNFIYVKNYDYKYFMSDGMLNYIVDKYLIDDELAAIQAINNDAGIGIFPRFICNYFPDIVAFEFDEKLKNLKFCYAIANIKKNFYTDFLLDLLIG